MNVGGAALLAPFRPHQGSLGRCRGPPPRPGRGGRKMSGSSAVSQTPPRRAQPTLVFRQIVAPVQPGHALGAALVEGRGECLFAGLVTTALTGKDRDPGD